MRWIVAVGLTGWIIGCSATLDEPRDAPPPTLEPPTQQPPIAGMPPLPPTQEGVPEGGVEGVLDCPTVELPPYTRGSTAALSRQFTTSCAACHGLYGQGQTLDGASYPSVPGELTFEEFAAVVREGRATMPSFAEGFIDEATLRADYEALGALNGAAPADLRPAGGEWTWTEAQVADALARGMEAWRKPDHEGVACANCHSPDALDLAIIGYTDDAILRRSGLHIPAEDAAAVVDFIHAQRRRFNITKPCSRDWRPLQPGGAVLPGDTAAEQDLAFARELQRRNYTLVTGVVETLDDAKLVYREMVETDLRRLPIGQALPRWTEDGFNGEDHSTVNDYLSGLGRVPNDHANWYALEDAYVGNPTDANLFELLHRFRDETNDMGFGNRSRDLGANRTGRCGTPIQGHGSVLSYLDFNKKRSVYIIQHFMRMAVLGQPGWFEQPSAPFPEYAHQFGQGLNPFYKIGADFAEHNCGRGALLVSNWPEEAAEEIPEDAGELSPASQMVSQLNHPWQTLGVIYDPGLLMQQGGGVADLHYWVIVGFEQRQVHMPFLYLMRILVQEHYHREFAHTRIYPPSSSPHSESAVHPLLHGKRLQFRDAMSRANDNSDELADFGNAIRCNAIRTVLLLQKELLEAGEPVQYPDDYGRNNTGSLKDHFRPWSQFADRWRVLQSDGLPAAFEGRERLCTSELSTLIEEVRTLADRAEDLGPDGSGG